MTRQQLSAKLKHAALFIAISCLPLAGWMMRNAAVSGGVAGRQIVYHPATLQHVKVGLQTVSLWLLPEHIPATNAQTPFALGLIAIVLVVGALVLMAHLAARRARRDVATDTPRPFARLPLISLIFIALFVVQLLLTISFLDRIIQLSLRYMATIHLLAILIAMHVVDRFLRAFPHKPGMRLLCAALVAFFALFSANRAVWTVNWFHQDGLGLSRTRWRTSKLIERVKHLDAATQVFTNAGDALYLHTNYKVWSIPPKSAYRTGLPNAHFDEQIARMRGLLERGEAVIVLFHQHDPGVLPSRAELEALVPLQVRTEVAGEGVILEIAQHEPDRPPSE